MFFFNPLVVKIFNLTLTTFNCNCSPWTSRPSFSYCSSWELITTSLYDFDIRRKKIFSHSHNFPHRRSWIEWIPSYVSLFGLVGDNVLILFHRRVNFTANIEPRGCLVDIYSWFIYLFGSLPWVNMKNKN